MTRALSLLPFTLQVASTLEMRSAACCKRPGQALLRCDGSPVAWRISSMGSLAELLQPYDPLQALAASAVLSEICP